MSKNTGPVRMYRCLFYADEEDHDSRTNRIMNALYEEGNPYGVFDLLIQGVSPLIDPESIAGESFLVDDDGDYMYKNVVTFGPFRMGWDIEKDSESIVLEQMYEIPLDALTAVPDVLAVWKARGLEIPEEFT